MDDLKVKFELSEKYQSMAKGRIDEILSSLGIATRENLVLIGVHFRGTDYGNILKMKENRNDVTAKFYEKSVQFYRQKFSGKKILFLVVTDDPKLATFILKSKSNIGSSYFLPKLFKFPFVIFNWTKIYFESPMLNYF